MSQFENFPKLKGTEEFSLTYDTTWKIPNSQSVEVVKAPRVVHLQTIGSAKFMGFTVIEAHTV